MTEPLNWLKLGSSRTGTPTEASPPEGKGAQDSQSHDPWSRIPASTSPEDASTDDGGDDHHLFVREQDRVWYNPSLDQMVDALLVLLMQNDPLKPIPVQYNSYVSHLIEGYANAQKKIRSIEAEHQVTKQTQEKDRQEFRQMARDWAERECQYRAEVKRLEVLLSQCSEKGLEAVTLARADSLVNRSGSKGAGPSSRPTISRKNAPLAGAGLGESQPSDDYRDVLSMGHERILTPRILDNDNDFHISQRFRQQDAAAKSVATHGNGTKDRRRQVYQPGLEFDNRYDDGHRDPLVGIQDVPVMTSVRQGKQPPADIGGQHDEPGRSQCQRDHLTPPAELAPSLLDYTGNSGLDFETVETTVASRHKRSESAFSFEAGDDFGPLPNDKAKVRLSLATERYESSSSSDSDGSFTVLNDTKEHAPPKNGKEPDTHSFPSNQFSGVIVTPKSPVRRSTDTIHSGRYATVGAQPGTRSLDPLLVTATADQEITQRRNTDTDAQLAARAALANVLGTTKKNK
ncbi:hypothetical protein F5Y08DRAFT_343079 [Xylaria arbuscula]|nr:hypothetical protein F5Y08DRAFT_343079 [Xylaria arbuscula]